MNAKMTIGLCGAAGLAVGLGAGYGIVRAREGAKTKETTQTTTKGTDGTKGTKGTDGTDRTNAAQDDDDDTALEGTEFAPLIKKIKVLLEDPDDQNTMQEFLTEQITALMDVSESSDEARIVDEVPQLQTRIIMALEHNIADYIPKEKKSEYDTLKDAMVDAVNNYVHNATIKLI